MSCGIALALFVAAAIGYNSNDVLKSKPDDSVQTLSDVDISSNNSSASGMIAIPGYDHLVMKEVKRFKRSNSVTQNKTIVI
ncbi:hypothetical protein [Thermoanaerobacterium butyriciformans]|uniref:Uncharacterized protein n=1 Tax=Thermoanaerobacterium butyriciformans TaxID=1702242 RepID=A0ABS4NBZ8_9THEO|nr:hypothetical protein [Thermoanaerobacterium butyriciformans]MBP2071189.1 hypothetical protein [Thermoanaerobacterium butyriciformans]